MRAQLELGDGAEPIDLVEFERWLRLTPAVNDSAQISVENSRSADRYMSAGDVLVLVCTTVTTLTSVVSAYAAWKTSRGSAPPLVVSIDGHPPVVVREGTPQELKPLELQGPSPDPAAGDRAHTTSDGDDDTASIG